MDKQNKTYCRNPFDGVVFAPNGRMQMCCVAQWVGDPKSFTDIKDINSVNDYFNGPYMKNIRERMLQGKFVPECTRCYRDEKLHGYSERTETNKKYFANNYLVMTYGKIQNQGKLLVKLMKKRLKNQM